VLPISRFDRCLITNANCYCLHNLSIWEKDTYYAPQDIIIAGGGLMGLWSALECTQRNPRLRITILEKNPTPLGASTRNAGFACFGSPSELLHDAETMGTESMLAIAELRYRGIRKIQQYFNDHQTGFELCGGYECIDTGYRHWDCLDEKTAWLNKELSAITGSDQIFRRCDERIASLGLRNFDALIENETEASLHSGKLMQALTKKVLDAGVQILYGIGITGWEENNSIIHIRTDLKTIFSAGRLLICTNGFMASLLPAMHISPARGQVIVTSSIPGLLLKGTFHFDEGYYYWRNLGNRILMGGARNKALAEEQTTDLSGSEKIKTALEGFLKRHLNENYAYTIDDHWSGIMGFTPDKKPVVRQVSANIFAAIACNGMGVALTPVMAEQVADIVFT
jgi:gamma-glutamylputrescine oxidase